MTNSSIQIEYNHDLKPLEELLSNVKRAGDFFVEGALEMPMPKVEVEGVGVLSFPVPHPQIAALVQSATRAPYGRGEETILDESVRKVWQLPSDKVRVSGKSWAANFDGILKRVVAGLGCEGMEVSPELYKLLVYDTGSFFLAHRDTEKANGMFGTLVIVLPSAHRGGELVIGHDGREVTVDLSGGEVSEVSFAAFYADCEHEVRPITDGNRVCLVFNLIQQQSPKAKRDTLRAPDYEKEITEAAELLAGNLSIPGSPAKIAWLLEHQYSPDGLAFAGLKFGDAARVRVLAQAAERADCAAHLGIVHIEESGSAQEQYYDYRPRRWGRYRDYDEDSDEEGKGSAVEDFEVIEVCDWRHYVSEWRDLRDQPVEFGEIPLEPGELLPGGALDKEKPDEQRYMEASGNEGATFERSYHRAALVIWRRERYAEVLLQAGVGAVLPYLKECIEACEVKSAPADVRKAAVALARRLVNAWKDAPEFNNFHQAGRPDKRDGMLRLLTRLGDKALLVEFIADIVTCDYDGSENPALVASARLLGAEEAGQRFPALVRQHMQLQHGHCIELLRALASATKASTKAEWQGALRQLAEAAVSGLGQVGKKRENEWTDWEIREKAPPVNAVLATKLLDLLNELGLQALSAEAVKQFAARPAVFDPVTILVPTLAAIRKWDIAAQRLWEHSARFLLDRSDKPPEPPRDWRQDAKLDCSCADCRELQAFTLNPIEQMRRFRVRQDRRQHLHQQIERHSLDMTHVTERKGSPQTLVCTKDRRSYKRRCDQYRKDIAALTSLENQGKKSQAGNQDMLKRIAAARSFAAQWTPE